MADAGGGDVRDVHSHATPHQIRVRHLELDLEVDFARRRLCGSATLTVVRPEPDARRLVLDTRDLVVHGVSAPGPEGPIGLPYELGDPDPVLGAPLRITLGPSTTAVVVRYETGATPSGLQWLEPEQTAGRRHPFVFTQSQAIHARSWIPLQDTPGVRITYRARVRTRPGLRALMSADNDPDAPVSGDYTFEMPQPVPSYLIALAVGELEFVPLGSRSGVYAEPSVVRSAAWEFADTEAMMAAAERLYGPYRWERYDLLVLPPSFPFGGMENPRLTFATPTVLAGDRSLVSLVAHELAHSWSGNLVTNATWRDFWLNEGFTTYIERRIIEEVYGPARAEMEAVLGRRTLDDELARFEAADQILHLDLDGRDPDDGMTQVPYEKGALFLCDLEVALGRPAFDDLVRRYFDTFAFQSITTSVFRRFLDQTLAGVAGAPASTRIDAWISEPGLPPSPPSPSSALLDAVARDTTAWLEGTVPAHQLETGEWSTHEWIHFLGALPDTLTPERLAEMDAAWDLTSSGNAEIAHVWLLRCVRAGYAPARSALVRYLTRIGRRKLIQPIYEALADTPGGRVEALEIYRGARAGYHPIAADSLDTLLGWPDA